MSEMVERVAKAIFISLYDAEEYWPDRVGQADLWIADDFRRCTRAAIAAMREPTEPMIDAFSASHIYDQRDLVRKHWRAMINEALKP